MSHSFFLARSHTFAPPIAHAKVGSGRQAGEDQPLVSDQPPPLLVIFQVEGAAGGAVLHRQRVGADGQRLGLCRRAQTPQ